MYSMVISEMADKYSRPGSRIKMPTMNKEVTAKLTKDQRKVLQDSFKGLYENPKRSGLLIFVGLFQDHPTSKNTFPQLKNVSDSVLMDSAFLQSHALHYMNSIQNVISAIDSDDDVKLMETVMRFANVHHDRKVNRRHIEQMLPSICEALKTVNGSAVKPEVEQAWKSLLEVIAVLVDELNESEHK